MVRGRVRMRLLRRSPLTLAALASRHSRAAKPSPRTRREEGAMAPRARPSDSRPDAREQEGAKRVLFGEREPHRQGDHIGSLAEAHRILFRGDESEAVAFRLP